MSNGFPDFNKWHKVPKDASIPANTPYYRMMPTGNDTFFRNGQSDDRTPEDRRPDETYYTREAIRSPEAAKIEQRARAMFYMVPDSDIWEHKDEYTQDAWRNLARRYIEKEG